MSEEIFKKFVKETYEEHLKNRKKILKEIPYNLLKNINDNENKPKQPGIFSRITEANFETIEPDKEEKDNE